MERKSNVSVWQLKLFEGFDRDIMVMQRDEEEVFDDAIHVFFDKGYYDVYVARASKYGTHRYAYHEDKLGEVVYQVFEEGIKGIVLHINAPADSENKGVLMDEKYISSKDLTSIRDAADSYHYLYTTSIDRCDRLDTIAHLWGKHVYIIGELPNPNVKPKEGEKHVYELMTIRRKADGSPATSEDYDYESLKVFLTADSAMRFNPDKRPVNKYRLSLISQFVKGKIRVIIEPHRNYNLEYDPANLDISAHLNLPKYDEDFVKGRIGLYTKLEKPYVLLAPVRSDYRLGMGNPFLVKPDDSNIIMYLFEKYEDAQAYVLQSPNILPVFDSTYPIGVVDNLEKLLCVATKLGVTLLNLDTDTVNAVGCKMEYFMKEAGYTRQLEEIVSEDELKNLMRITEAGEKQYRMPVMDFGDKSNDYLVTDERKEEIISHIDNDLDNGLGYASALSIAELMVLIREVSIRFDKARKEENEDDKVRYNRIMNLFTVVLTELLCEKPYIYALKDENGEFQKKNNMPYLIVTNRYESVRKGEGRLSPVSIDNIGFMDKLLEAGAVAALTDGPQLICLLDVKLMHDVAIQWNKSAPLREELLIYMTQGLDLSYEKARYYYKRIKSDSPIFVEFISTLRNGDYPQVGMLNIEGHTAKELADEHGYSILEAYDALLSIKTDRNYLESNANESNSDNVEEKEEKKGLFGKIFKK